MAGFQSCLLNNYSLKLACEREKTERVREDRASALEERASEKERHAGAWGHSRPSSHGRDRGSRLQMGAESPETPGTRPASHSPAFGDGGCVGAYEHQAHT